MPRCIPVTGLLLIAGLAANSAAAREPTQSFPPLVKAYSQYSGCPDGQGTAETIRALDFSTPADDEILKAAKAAGITTILRYYDWPEPPPEMAAQPRRQGHRCQAPERSSFDSGFDLAWKPGPSIKDKTLTDKERKRIHDKELSIGIVFQHCNDDPDTFKDGHRASYDADRVVELARSLSQPKGTIVFFGVDYDVTKEVELSRVENYFKTIHDTLAPHGYKIGVYGNGLVCERLKLKNLASACWLSQSTGFQGSKAYAAKGDWDIKQCATREAFPGSSVKFDPNVLKGSGESIGFWKPN